MWNACHLIAWIKNINITEHRERKEKSFIQVLSSTGTIRGNQLVIHKHLSCFSVVSTSEEKSKFLKPDETHRSVLASRILTYRQVANNSSHQTMKLLANTQPENMQLEQIEAAQQWRWYRLPTASVQLMYLLSTQLGNLKVQLINTLKFICQRRTMVYFNSQLWQETVT